MPALSEQRIVAVLRPYLDASIDLFPPSAGVLVEEGEETLASKLGLYLDLLMRWNARTNLTALRDPEAIVGRHFGESLFAARVLARMLQPGNSLLDIGSGAGFPGLPIALWLPRVRVTLAESQGKKVAFLREVVRGLGLSVEVWGHRVEVLPDDHKFSAVTLRAVDRPEAALAVARQRVQAGGWLLELTAGPAKEGDLALPGHTGGVLRVTREG